MRTTAIIINLVLLGLVGKLAFGGEFSLNSDEAPLFLAMLAAPILSTIALLLRGAPNKDWLARYCERKALEERRKLGLVQKDSAQPCASGESSQPVCSETNAPSAPAGSRR